MNVTVCGHSYFPNAALGVTGTETVRVPEKALQLETIGWSF